MQMINRLAIVCALGLAAAGTAIAADAPKDTKSCMDSVFALAKTAQEKKLSDDKLNQIEGLMTTMEDHCTSEKFADAAKVGAEITAAIDN